MNNDFEDETPQWFEVVFHYVMSILVGLGMLASAVILTVALGMLASAVILTVALTWK